MNGDGNPVAIFVADTHFHLRPDAAERSRLRRFLDLLHLAHRADHLILLGDIFDFWFDYPHFRLKGYEELLQGLDGVVAAGTRIHFIGGNHDIWAADYLQQRYGIEGRGKPLTLQLGQLRVRLVHGDGILGSDWQYSTFRAVVRNPLGMLLAKSLHPEILFAISTWLSGQSRCATRDEGATMVAKATAWLQSQASPNWDLLVIGHLHHPFVIDHSGRRLASLGGWLDREGYGLLRHGRFQLLDYASDPWPSLAPPDSPL